MRKVVDVGRLCSQFLPGCMGLPQELVDLITGMLHDDLPALRSCSLTCRSMFVSTRHLIHRTLYLTPQNNERILTKGETMRLREGGRDKVPQRLRILSYMGEHGFLRYTRQVYISYPGGFVPEALGYHFRHFESFDKVHTLTIEFFDVMRWAPYFKQCFLQFHTTLTSLTLRAPVGHHRLFLEFAMQFPKLDNLSLECPERPEMIPPHLDLPGIATSPPLRGQLRLTGATTETPRPWLMDLAYALPNGINFRSIELEDICGHQAQHVVDACGRTLEDLILVPYQHGFLPQLYDLQLTEAKILRKVTFRTKHPKASSRQLHPFIGLLSTITSPAFCEFVIELDKHPSYGDLSSLKWGRWGVIDRFLCDKFSHRENFRLTVRSHWSYDRELVQWEAIVRFPMLFQRGCLHFETFNSIERFGS